MGKDSSGIGEITVNQETSELGIQAERKRLKLYGSWRLHLSLGNYYEEPKRSPLNFDFLVNTGDHNFLVHPGDIDFLVEKLSDPDIHQRFELGIRIITSEGTIRQLQASGRIINPDEINHEEIKEVETQIELESKMFQYTETVTNTGSWKWNVKKNVVSFTENIYRIYGIDPIVPLKTWDDLLPYVVLNDRHKVGELVTVLKKPGDSTTFDYRITRSNDHARRYLRTKAEIISTTTGELFCIGTTHDITREKLAEKKIQEIEVRASRIQQEALAKIGWQENLFKEAEIIGQMGSYEVDVPGMEIKLSENMYRLLGYKPGAFPPSIDFIDSISDKEDVIRVRSILEKAIRDKKPYQYDRRIHLPNGQIRHLHSRGRVVLDHSGNVIKLIGIVQDITSQVAQELSQKENGKGKPVDIYGEDDKIKLVKHVTATLLESAFETSPNSICVFEILTGSSGEIVDFKFIMVNEYTKIATGTSDLIGRNYTEVFPTAIESGVFAAFVQVAKTGETADFEKHYHGESLNRWFRFICKKSGNDLIVTTIDVTSQKEIEFELNKSKKLLQSVFDSAIHNIIVLEALRKDETGIYDFKIVLADARTGNEPAPGVPLVGNNYLESYPALKNSIIPLKFREVIDTGVRADFQVKLIPSDERSWCRFLVVKLGDGIVVSWENVSEKIKAEQSQQRVRKLLQGIFEAIPLDLVYLKARRNEKDEVNDFFIEMINESCLLRIEKGKEVVGYSIREAIPGIEFQPLWNSMFHVFNTRNPEQRESCFKKEERDQWVLTSTIPFSDGVLVAGLDITARKTAEKELEESKQFVQQVTEHSPDFIYVLDLSTGKPVYFNRSLYKILGYPRRHSPSEEEVFLNSLIHPEDLESRKKQLSRLSGIKLGEVIEMELRLKHMNETWEWFNVRETIFDHGTSKKPAQVLGVIRNISKQKETEEEMNKNLQILKQTEEVAGIGSWEYIIPEKQFNWSHGMYRMFGLPDGTPVTPESYRDFVIDEDYSLVEKFIHSTRISLKPIEEVIRIWVDGKTKTIKVKSAVIKNERGIPVKVLGVDLDISAIVNSENEIKDQAHFISRIVETIPDMLSVMELPSRIMTYVNQEPFVKQGFEPITWLNRNSEDRRHLIHPDDTHVVDEYFDKFLSLGDNVVNTIEYRGRHNESSAWSWFKARGAVFKRNREGIPTHCVNVVQNINTQKQAEEKVREQGHYIQRLVETVPDTIFIFDINLNRLIYSNPEVQQLLGYTPDEIQLLGAEVLDHCIFPDDLEDQKKELLKFVDAADNEVFESVFRMIHRDGTIRRVQARQTPFKRGSNGKVSQVVSIFHDITSLKMAEEENLLMKEMLTRQAEDKYRQLFNSIDEGFCILDILFDEQGEPIDYLFLETNPAFEKQTGLKDSKGATMRQFRPDHDEHWYQVFGEVVKTGEPKQFLQYAREFGNRWFEVYAFPVSPGNNNTVAVLFNDVTAWRKTEQQLKELNEKLQESDRAKTVFFSNVSHEFRTPLTLLLGPLEELLIHAEEKAADKDDIDKLKLAHRNALRLQKLVNNLLDFSRLEAGRLQASFIPTDLGKYTADLASNFRSVIENGGVKFIINTDNFHDEVLIDREMWEKIVFNLLSNAFKFTFHGEIEISVTSSDNSVELMVRDTGSGIAAEHLPKLFDRFHRIEGTPSRAYEGSGIGLALVHELVKIHDGSIHVESKPGHGTAFYVRIPLMNEDLLREPLHYHTRNEMRSENKEYLEEKVSLSTVDYSQIQNFTAGGEIRKDRTGLPLIILADDHADMREYLRSMLIENFEVLPVENGQRVVDLLKKGVVPDLILSDVMMPELDGFELLQKIKANQVWNRIPVILVSARAGEEARVEGMEYGADDYLVKPFSSRELMARLNARIEISMLRNQREDLLKEINKQLEKHVFERTRELLESRDELQKQKELLQRCLDALPQLVWTTDPLGNFSMFNDRWYSYTGLPFEIAEGATYIKSGVIHPSQVKEVEAKWQFSINEGIPYSNETLIRNKEGEYRWHLDLVMPIKNDYGEIFMWVGTLTDVNEQFVAEKHLEDHKNLLETVFDFSPSGIQVLESIRDGDTHHIIDFEWRYFNANIRDVFENGDLEGKRFTEVYPDSLQNGMLQILREVIISGEPSRYEQKYKFGTTELWLDVSVVKLEDSVVVSWHNITDRVHSEMELTHLNSSLKQKNHELESMNEQLSTFAFVASHDLREPLRKIQFFVSSIKQTDADQLTEKGTVYFNKILLAVDRMNALINDILKFSRANANSEDFDVVDLNKVLIIATNDLSETIKEKGAVISTVTLPSVRGNQTQLIQLFENLISNGIKFHKEDRRPTVDINVKTISGKSVNHPSVIPDTEYLVIQIADNGIGFEEQYITKIFQMFQRLHGITEYPGTGMGLAICKKIMENHGGFIHAESTPGEGASFSCYFPK